MDEIERVARAICVERGWNPNAFHPPSDDYTIARTDHAIPLWVQMRKEARARIEAAFNPPPREA